MNAVAVVIVVIGGVAVAGAVCWFVVAAALRRSRSGNRNGHTR